VTDFNWLTAALIFFGYAIIDWLMTIYTLSVVSKKKLKAANAGTTVYLLTSFGVINYVEDYRYIVPLLVGGWLGTYLSVWHEELKHRMPGVF